MMYHEPVLLKECIEGLNIKPNGVYVDVTFGGGGHTTEILKKLTTGKVVAFDQDPDAEKNIPDDKRLIFFRQNFRFLKNNLKFSGLIPVDGVLADLGVSSFQLDKPEKGFSTRFDANLDMRMDPGVTRTAADVLNISSQEELERIFKEYGELKDSASLARRIAETRKEKPLRTTSDLKEISLKGATWGKENKYLAQVFQALRIEINQEIDALKEFLLQSAQVIKPGGRLVVMSYHSLEDRLVKNYIRQGKFEGQAEKDLFGRTTLPFKDLTRKPIVAGEVEVKKNPRSRSVRLRIAEKN